MRSPIASTGRAAEYESHLTTLDNGVRVLVVPLPHLASASVSVFVRTGSRHESRRENGLSHVVEHMAFKGTATRSCQRINLDAERLGAEVNAHTDKDHTAYHMRGLAPHAVQFVQMLADIVQHSTFPAEELERERQVILQELTEDEDDAFSTAFKLFDRCCWGDHALAQPVIGRRRNIERFDRDDLIDYVRRQYSGDNVVVAVAGAVDAQAIVQAATDAFGGLPRGRANQVDAPRYEGGLSVKRMAGVSQTHLVLGYPIAPLADAQHVSALVACAVFGEGMSSPLMDRVRERLGLVYYAACSADVTDIAGQFVIEASMAPEHVGAFTREVTQLLDEHAQAIDPLHLERARNQIAVRRLEVQERPFRLLEEAVQDLFVFGRVRTLHERQAAIEGVSAEQVRAVFQQLCGTRAAIGLAGRVRREAQDALQALAAG